MSDNTSSMKASCLQENLAKGLSIVSRAVATRSTMPVLGNILVATDEGRLKLSATNLEIGISCWVPASVEEEGATTIPARTFVDLINALPGERVDMALDTRTQTLNIKCGRFNNNIRGIDAKEFPLLPSAAGAKAICIEPGVLSRAIEQVAFTAATDNSRPILTGVLARLQDDNTGQGSLLTFAAADGFRLSVRADRLAAQVTQPVAAIIPARAMEELQRVIKLSGPQFAAQEGPVSVIIAPGKNQVLFHLDNVDLASQLIDGNFPDYTPIIPKKHTTRAVVNTAELAKAYKMANVFARESAHMVKLTLTPSGEAAMGRVAVSAVSAETGDNASVVDAAIEGDPVEITFNAKYMLQVLSVVGTPQVALELTTSTTPGLLRPIGDGNFTHVIMPMQPK